jgi:hypothetical protein
MHPVIRAIPTFGTYPRCYHGRTGYKPAEAKYSSQSVGKDDLGGWDRPDRWLPGC